MEGGLFFFFSKNIKGRPHLGGHTQGILGDNNVFLGTQNIFAFFFYFFSRLFFFCFSCKKYLKKQPTHISNQRRTTNNKNNFFNLGTALLFATWEVESEEDKEEDKDDG